MIACCFFFFSSRRRHTRFDCDWSSDVCSSDLLRRHLGARTGGIERQRHIHAQARPGVQHREAAVLAVQHRQALEIGRASWRERVEISVGAVSLKKKTAKGAGGTLLAWLARLGA